MESSETIEANYHQAIGEALTTWGQVEQSHCVLFGLATTKYLYNIPMHRAYWSITAFENRLKMVDAALIEIFSQHPSFLERWKNINSRLSDKNSKRNKLAHCQLVLSHSADKEPKIELVPFYFGGLTKSAEATLKAGISLQDIHGITRAFQSLFSDLHGLIEDLTTNLFGDEFNEERRATEVFVYPTPTPINEDKP